MKKLVTLQILFVITLTANTQILVPKKDYKPEIRQARYSFTFNLISGANSSLVSLGIMRQLPDSTHEIIFLTKDAFIRQAMGSEESRANPQQENLFELYGVNSSTIDNLWKLKYSSHPFSQNEQLGWGSELNIPSKLQMEMLKPFGIITINDYVYGDNFWRLLQKMNDPMWIGDYLSRN